MGVCFSTLLAAEAEVGDIVIDSFSVVRRAWSARQRHSRTGDAGTRDRHFTAFMLDLRRQTQIVMMIW